MCIRDSAAGDHLGGIEGEGAGSAKTACMPPFEGGAVSMGGILNELQPPFIAELPDLVDPGGDQAADMYNDCLLYTSRCV